MRSRSPSLAVAQTLAVSIVGVRGARTRQQRPLALVVGFALLNALLGMALGLFVSAFATTEFQAVQFLPAFLLPQLLLCGLLVPRDGMTRVLRWLSDFLPMTYAYDALHRVAIDGTSRRLALDAVVLGGFMLAALGAGALTLGGAPGDSLIRGSALRVSQTMGAAEPSLCREPPAAPPRSTTKSRAPLEGSNRDHPTPAPAPPPPRPGGRAPARQ